MPGPVPGLEHREAALPKLLIMGLRDHAFAKAPYILADEDDRAGLDAAVIAEAERALVSLNEARRKAPPAAQ